MPVEIPEVELEIESPLRDCFECCETICERRCCGIKAFDSRPVFVREWADAQDPQTAATAVSQLDALIAITRDRLHRVSSDFLNHFTLDESARAQLLHFLQQFRLGLSGEPLAYQLSDADKVWNRACGLDAWRGEGPRREGDFALAALLRVHGMVMNGGLEHAFDVFEPLEFDAGIAGFRYFGLDDHANLLVCVRPLNEEEQDELTPKYSEYGEDEVLQQAFEKKFENHPEQFAPLGG
jgi:hypothetical protein